MAALSRAKSRSCPVGRGERLLRGLAAALLVAFAATSLDNLFCAVPAATCAAFLAIGAITGWCPANLLSRTSTPTEPNELGYPEAPQELLP